MCHHDTWFHSKFNINIFNASQSSNLDTIEHLWHDVGCMEQVCAAVQFIATMQCDHLHMVNSCETHPGSCKIHVQAFLNKQRKSNTAR